MKGIPNIKIIEKELEMISRSSQFANSEKERKLLQYLVKKTLANEFIKEVHIAIDVFNKETDFDPSVDSTVRVYIGKVRKKLETFYLTDESRNVNLRFNIPKGSYTVQFEKRTKKKRQGRLKTIATISVISTFAMLAVFIFHLIDDKNDIFSYSKSVSNNPVWKEYSKSDLPTLIVIGDFYFMTKNIDNRRYIVRNSNVNSSEDFLSNQLDTLGFEEYRFTYSPSNMPECVTFFIPHLVNNKEPFKIKRASQLTWEDINSNNIIFIGDFKTLYILNRLLPRFNVRYDPEEKSYSLLDENNEAIDEFDFILDQEGSRNENIVVIKRPGGNNNVITLIMALGRGGIDDVSKKLCDPEFLHDLIETYRKGKSSTPFYFDMVFEMEGIEETSLISEIVYFNQIIP